mmetsp:Transcript_129/g.300  ORF Transcript_129/g.300 Transcript_129/m.300 type:complete len:644 (+) Transcript_129:191-2122(+)
MRANIASGATASTTPARIMCVLLALPAIICAPPVPPAFNGGDNAVEQIPGHYLRHVVSENYDHDIIDGRNDSFLMSFFARLRSTTQVGDDTDMDDRGKDQIVDPLRIEDDVSDYSERRLQPSSPKWYVNWIRSTCVQSCPPTTTNPHCDGYARWDQHLFDTAEYCCSVALNWQSVEYCIDTTHSYISSFTVDTTNNSGGGDRPDGICPVEYSRRNDYVSKNEVTVYVTETKGQVYQCKEGPLSQYCNLFPPNWSRSSFGGGSVHTTDSFGWKLIGDCVVPIPDDPSLSSNSPGVSVTPADGGNKHSGKKPPAVAKPVGTPTPPPKPVLSKKPTTQGGSVEDSPSLSGSWPITAGLPSAAGGENDAIPIGSIGFGTGEGSFAGSGGDPSDYASASDSTSSVVANNSPQVASKPVGRPTRPPRPKLLHPKKPHGGSGGSSPSTSGSWPTTGTGDGTANPPSPAGSVTNPIPINSIPINPIGFETEDEASGGGGGPSSSASGGDSSSSEVNNNYLPPNNGAGTSVAGIEEGGSYPPAEAERNPLIGKKPAKPKPTSQGDQKDGIDVIDLDINIIDARPGLDRPDKPGRPYKPKPAVQVQQSSDPNYMEEEDMIEKDGSSCWRSGTKCDTHAEVFACCTQCINGICI